MLRILSFLTFILAGTAAFAAPMTEQDKIKSLLDAFKEPGITFIRNGEEHDGAWARQHLQEKLDKAKDVKTAEDFITKVASTSSHSGKPYQVKLKDGKVMDSGKWLHKKLAALEGQKYPCCIAKESTA